MSPGCRTDGGHDIPRNVIDEMNAFLARVLGRGQTL